MVLSSKQKAMLRKVAVNFIESGGGSFRNDLVLEFEDPHGLDQLANDDFFERSQDHTTYWPRFKALVLCEDELVFVSSKNAALAVFPSLREMLIRREAENVPFEALAFYVSQKHSQVLIRTLHLGLFLASQLGLLKGWSSNPSNRYEFAQFSISEYIISYQDFAAYWEEKIGRVKGQEEERNRAEAESPRGGFRFEIPVMNDWRSLSVRTDPNWSDIHPDVAKFLQPYFDDGYQANGILDVLKELNRRVREKAGIRRDLDGDSLYRTVFSMDHPLLRFGDLETDTGSSKQVGYQNLFYGVMKGVRNPAAHHNLEFDSRRLKHLVYVISLLFYLLDEAEPVRTNSGQP